METTEYILFFVLVGNIWLATAQSDSLHVITGLVWVVAAFVTPFVIKVITNAN